MNGLKELKDKAGELKKLKKYDEALRIYRTLWESHRSLCNEWDGWSYAFCLRKTRKLDEALSICREVYRMKKDFSENNNLYAWCIYELEIKKNHDEIKKNEETFFKGARAVLNLSDDDKYSEYSPYTSTVFKVIEYIKSKYSYNPEDIITWTDKLKPEQLSEDCYEYKDKNGRPVKLPSYREKWYLLRTESLKRLGKFEACLKVCNEAINNLPNCMNNVWFKHRIAIAKWNTGKKDEAISELKAILKEKKEWFIEYDIARFYYEMGNLTEGLLYGIDSALNYGEPEKKLELYVLLGLILKSMKKNDFSGKHIAFASKLREEKGWKIPVSLLNLIKEFKIDISSSPSSYELYKELKKYWHQVKYSDFPAYYGKIIKLLRNKQSGFIKGENGKNYYFKGKSFKGDNLKRGMKVKFNIEKSFDRKKCEESEEAVNISEI